MHHAPRPAAVTVTVIVVGYNHADCLGACLDALVRQEALDELQLVYVDNASLDASLAEARRHSRVVILANDRNEGFARAVNQGLQLASGHFVALVNPDTIPGPHTLKALTNVLRDHPDVGLVGATLLDTKGLVQSGFSPYPSFGGLFAKRLGRTPDPASGWITGAVLLLRTELLRQLGGLDERFFVYGEDMDLCFRVQRRGMAVHLAPAVRVFHRGNSRWSADRLLRVYGAYLRFAGLHHGARRLPLGAALSLLWLARGAALGQSPQSLASGLFRLWSMRPDRPPPSAPSGGGGPP